MFIISHTINEFSIRHVLPLFSCSSRRVKVEISTKLMPNKFKSTHLMQLNVFRRCFFRRRQIKRNLAQSQSKWNGFSISATMKMMLMMMKMVRRVHLRHHHFWIWLSFVSSRGRKRLWADRTLHGRQMMFEGWQFLLWWRQNELLIKTGKRMISCTRVDTENVLILKKWNEEKKSIINSQQVGFIRAITVTFSL